MIYTRFYTERQLPFNKTEALRYFGYPQNSSVSKEVETLFDECVKELLLSCTYKVCYAVFDCTVDKEGKRVDLSFTQAESRALSLNLDGCQRVVAFAATIGVGIDRLICRYSAVQPVKAYAFQAIGAERIETLCNFFNEEIKREYGQRGLFIRPRFSCGYGDFSIERQRDFITALDANRKIGVSLNDSLILSPSKSVTAVIGIAKTACRSVGNQCDFCNYTDCSFKKQ